MKANPSFILNGEHHIIKMHTDINTDNIARWCCVYITSQFQLVVQVGNSPVGISLELVDGKPPNVYQSLAVMQQGSLYTSGAEGLHAVGVPPGGASGFSPVNL